MMRAVPLVLALTVALAAADTKPAPAIELRAAGGSSIRLADLKGQVVLVDFWASWCAPCKRSFPALDALYRELHPRGLDVVAINLDERRRDADDFLGAHPHEMPVVFDPRGESARAFDIQGMPSSVLIDRAGRIRFTHMGYSDKVIDSYRQEISMLLGERPQ